MKLNQMTVSRATQRGGLLVLAVLGLSALARAQYTVVPNAYTSTEGENGLSTVIGPNARTLQMVIRASELSGIPLNYEITGLAFRLNSGQPTSPGFPILFSNYDIYIGSASVAPLGASNTFLNNYASPSSKRQVRQGALSLDSTFFPNSGTAPNNFSADIAFNLTGYAYTGGDLVIEISHSGNGGANFAIDATPNSATAAAYGAAGYNATTNTNINSQGETVLMPIVRLTALTPAPEPAALSLLALGGLALLVRRRR